MAPDSEKRVRVAFYRTAAGNLPVREWLKDLDPEDLKIVGDDLRTVELGWPLGLPLCRSLSSHKGLWEARSALPGNREARVLFCLAEGCMVLLHGFIKKTQKTPITVFFQNIFSMGLERAWQKEINEQVGISHDHGRPSLMISSNSSGVTV